MPIRPSVPIAPLVALVVALAATEAPARDRTPATGSAIAPMFSLEHSSMRPGEAVVMTACVTNRNPDGRRLIDPGDALSFDATGATLGACEMAPVETRGAPFDPGDWTCEVDGSTLRLVYGGPRRTWPQGELACARVHVIAPPSSMTVVPAVEPANRGAWAPAEPALLFLSVDAEVGSVGPAGPMGPVGPAGPSGPSGLGAHVMARSENGIVVLECDPPRPVPGLALDMSVADGSRLLVLADVVSNKACREFAEADSSPSTTLLLELDGVVATRHFLPDPDRSMTDGNMGVGSGSSFSWLSAPLPAGSHDVRILAEFGNSDPTRCFHRTGCIGGLPDSKEEAHLVVLEIRSP